MVLYAITDNLLSLLYNSLAEYDLFRNAARMSTDGQNDLLKLVIYISQQVG